MSYLRNGCALLCVIFLIGVPLSALAQDVAAPNAEEQVELAPGESEDISTEDGYASESLSPEEENQELADQDVECCPRRTYRLDAGLLCLSSLYDRAWLGDVLWWPGKEEEYCFGVDAMFVPNGADECCMGYLWI